MPGKLRVAMLCGDIRATSSLRLCAFFKTLKHPTPGLANLHCPFFVFFFGAFQTRMHSCCEEDNRLPHRQFDVALILRGALSQCWMWHRYLRPRDRDILLVAL
jgi:hypothetical protein